MERYPVLGGGGEVRGFQVSSVEFSVLYSSDQREKRSYMWITSEYGVPVDEYIDNGVLRVGGVSIEYARLVEDIPWPLVYVTPSLEDYIGWVAGLYGAELRGKTVMVNFSGGKDSTAVLAVVAGLQERLEGLKAYAVYSHVSFLEPPRNIDFAVKAAERLGVDIEVVEADRELMKKRLLEEGLPYRGRRWCTYMKLRPIKMLKKQRRPHIIADGDRMTEAFKRFMRLYQMSPRKPRLYSGGRLRPIYIWTLLDIVQNVRALGLVHPDYYEGLPRVACMMCPYKALHEFSEKQLELLEDPGLIEEAIKTSYRRWYPADKIPWEDFRSQHLWRHHPVVALKMYRAKRLLTSREPSEEIRAETVEAMYRSLWTNPMPRAPHVNPDDAVRELSATVLEAYRAAVAKAEEARRIVEAERENAPSLP